MEAPNEINQLIFSNLSMADLVRFARTSQQHNQVSTDDELWLDLLSEDFYFTKATAKTNFESHKFACYKELYIYCHNYLLNQIQNEAIDSLKIKGLTHEHLKGRDWFISTSHKHALITLIDNKKMEVQAALAELDCLAAEQAEGIYRGLTRNEVIGLKNMLEIEVFLCLKNNGLKGEQLKINDRWSSDYLKALLYLVNERNLKVQTALDQLNGLEPQQLRSIHTFRCTPEEVKSLDSLRFMTIFP